EPTAGEVEGGCNGTMRAVIRTTGRRAHAGRAWMGENAIHAAAPILARLAAYEPQTITVEGLDYREGLNAVRIAGGAAGHVIPAAGEDEVSVRSAPGRTPDEASARVRGVFDGFAAGVTDGASAARPGLDAPLARDFLEAVGAEAKPKYWWTDVARFS